MQTWHFGFSAAVTYIIVNFFPRAISRQVAFVFAMGYIIGAHIYRMYTDYLGWTLDFTGPLMLLTIKFTAYAFDTYDMQRSEEDLKELEKTDKVLASYIRSNKMDRKMNLLEYTSYIFWFNNILSGPVLTPSDHLKFLDMTQFPDGKIPSGSYTHALKIFLYALGVAPFVILKGYFDFSFCFTPAYQEYSLLFKSLFLWIASSLMRSTYYFAWLLSESSNIVSGIAFSGFDPTTNKAKWDKASNVRVMKIETAKTFKDVTENWNLSADKWLRYYIYVRIPYPFNKYGMYITYLASAVWHGLYPGYYLAFGGSSFGTHMTRVIFKNVRPWFVDPKTRQASTLYNVLMAIFNSYIISYCFLPFALLSWDKSISVFNSVYWNGHLTMIAVILALRFVKPPRPAKKEE